MPLAAAVSALAFAAAPHGAAACASADVPYATDEQQARDGLLCLVNDERAARGLVPLIEDPSLDDAAQAHVEDMADNHYFDHTAPDGSGPSDRAARAGYPGDVSETLFQVDGDEPDATPRLPVTAWMQSREHCSALLSPELRDLGAGVTRTSAGGDVTYTWVLELGVVGGPSPTSGAPCPAPALVTPAPPPGVTLSGARTLTLEHNAARVALHCASTSAACRGRATLTAHGRTLGHATLALAAGRTKTVRVPVAGVVDAKATLRLSADGVRTAIPVTLSLMR